MPAASYIMTSAGYPGNWGDFNGVPGQIVTRARFIDLSATPASAAAGYEIFNIPSFTLLKDIMFVKISGCSTDDAEIQLGDATASTAFYAQLSMSLAAWDDNTQVGSYASANAMCTFYVNGGKIQYVCSASQSIGAFWVVVDTINLKPV
jgi:hypothetical protein